MRPSSIKYDPYKSLDEIAADSGVTVNAVRSYIKTHNIDRKFDDETIRHRRVTAYMRDHCDATIPQIANELGMAVGTVRKYACAKFTTQLSIGKISMLEDSSGPVFISVSESETQILRAILSNHLSGALTFDCDLTIGRGAFYKDTVPLPRYLYDICPRMNSVKNLDEAINLPDGVFSSVVIDLPYTIVKPTLRRTRRSFASFDSLEQLYEDYRKMIKLSWRLLKDDGLLVFKTTDFRLAGEPVWISDWTIDTAADSGFTLADKYIFVDRKAINSISAINHRTNNIPTHAYFLVFRKR